MQINFSVTNQTLVDGSESSSAGLRYCDCCNSFLCRIIKSQTSKRDASVFWPLISGTFYMTLCLFLPSHLPSAVPFS